MFCACGISWVFHLYFQSIQMHIYALVNKIFEHMNKVYIRESVDEAIGISVSIKSASGSDVIFQALARTCTLSLCCVFGPVQYGGSPKIYSINYSEPSLQRSQRYCH